MLTGFEQQASGAVLDLTGDDDQAMRSKKNDVKWDVKKRKYVKADQVRFLHNQPSILNTSIYKVSHLVRSNNGLVQYSDHGYVSNHRMVVVQKIIQITD